MKSVTRDTAPIIATVGPEKLTLVEFEAELLRRSRSFQSAEASSAAREKLLAEMIHSKAALARAREIGFDQKPEIARRIEDLIATRYLEEMMDSGWTVEPSVSDDDAVAYYTAHADQFLIPAAIRAGIIVFEISEKATAEKRAAARLHAETVRHRALQAGVQEFNRLVQQHSQDQSTRYIGGDTGWLSKETSANRWPLEMLQAALTLKSPGEISPVVETPGNFFIIRLNERREAAARPLSEVDEAIRYRLLQAKLRNRQEAIARELTNGLVIHINREALAKFATSQPDKSPVPPLLPD